MHAVAGDDVPELTSTMAPSVMGPRAPSCEHLFPRFLLSRDDAPRIGNRFMKFALDKGAFFKPGAPRWAFLFGKGSQCRRQGEPGRSGGMIHG